LFSEIASDTLNYLGYFESEWIRENIRYNFSK
jgi:hypothetical protein